MQVRPYPSTARLHGRRLRASTARRQPGKSHDASFLALAFEPSAELIPARLHLSPHAWSSAQRRMTCKTQRLLTTSRCLHLARINHQKCGATRSRHDLIHPRIPREFHAENSLPQLTCHQLICRHDDITLSLVFVGFTAIGGRAATSSQGQKIPLGARPPLRGTTSPHSRNIVGHPM